MFVTSSQVFYLTLFKSRLGPTTPPPPRSRLHSHTLFSLNCRAPHEMAHFSFLAGSPFPLITALQNNSVGALKTGAIGTGLCSLHGLFPAVSVLNPQLLKGQPSGCALRCLVQNGGSCHSVCALKVCHVNIKLLQ